jgi:hypothetical protein
MKFIVVFLIIGLVITSLIFYFHRSSVNPVCSENPGNASLFSNMLNRLPRSARDDGLQRKARPPFRREPPPKRRAGPKILF